MVLPKLLKGCLGASFFLSFAFICLIVARYRKGANAERELIQMLFAKGFSVVRVAGSGATSLPCPDCLALSKQKKLAFECKAWSGKYLHLSKQQMEELVEWSDNAGLDLFIAWKIPREGWRFIQAQDFKKNEKNYTLTQHDAKHKGVVFSVLIGEQNTLLPK